MVQLAIESDRLARLCGSRPRPRAPGFGASSHDRGSGPGAWRRARQLECVMPRDAYAQPLLVSQGAPPRAPAPAPAPPTTPCATWRHSRLWRRESVPFHATTWLDLLVAPACCSLRSPSSWTPVVRQRTSPAHHDELDASRMMRGVPLRVCGSHTTPHFSASIGWGCTAG